MIAPYRVGTSGAGEARADLATGAVLWRGVRERAGVSFTYAWGVDDRGDRNGWLAEGFVAAEPAEAQLRQRMHAAESTSLAQGESLDSELTVPGAVRELIEQALLARPELQSLDRQSRPGASASAARTGMFPSVTGQFSVDVANPNQRYTPQSQEFNTTWGVALQAQWSPTGAFAAGAAVSRLSAQRASVLAQLAQLREAVEMEVRSVWISAQTANAAIESARRQVESAEESYRVRRERFVAGSAVSSDLTDAELDHLRAHLVLVNANVDLWEALARLRSAVGELD